MNQQLEAIKIAMDDLDFNAARALSDTYVAAHPEEFTEYADMAIESVVQAVDVFRAAGMVDHQYRAEAWHLHTWEPQTIGGGFQPSLRNPS